MQVFRITKKHLVRPFPIAMYVILIIFDVPVLSILLICSLFESIGRSLVEQLTILHLTQSQCLHFCFSSWNSFCCNSHVIPKCFVKKPKCDIVYCMAKRWVTDVIDLQCSKCFSRSNSPVLLASTTYNLQPTYRSETKKLIFRASWQLSKNFIFYAIVFIWSANASF